MAGAGQRRQAEGDQVAERLEPAGHRRGQGLLGCDVWEHSYYLDFRNRRPDYLQNWVDNLANYEYAEAQLKSALMTRCPAGASKTRPPRCEVPCPTACLFPMVCFTRCSPAERAGGILRYGAGRWAVYCYKNLQGGTGHENVVLRQAVDLRGVA